MSSIIVQNEAAQKRPRVVINKAKDLASQGSSPWNNTLRQILVDEHALHETWEPVTKILKRSNQALRSEWNKMKSGQRKNEGNWQEKVELCEARRRITLSSGSGTRDPSTTADSDNATPADSVAEAAWLLVRVAEDLKHCTVEQSP